MMKEKIKSEVEEIDRKIAELKQRRRELLAELGEGRLSWGAIIAGAFGALMTGLGIIALFAANWDELGRAARAAVAVAPTLICGMVALVSMPDQLFMNERLAPVAEDALREAVAQEGKGAVAVYRVKDGEIVITDVEIDGKPIGALAKEKQ